MEALGINLGFFIAQLINFMIIYFVLRRLLWKPLITVMEKRSAEIERGLEDARIAGEARANAERDAESIRNEARAEAQKIVGEARGRAEESAKEVMAQAQKDGEDARASARTQAEEERNQLLADMRSQVISLAVAAANHLIGQTIDQKKQSEIVNDFFSAVPDNVKDLGDSIEVVSALPLTDAEKNKVSKATGAKNIEYKVDPKLLGGLILRAGDKVVDGSVRSGLSSLSTRLN